MTQQANVQVKDNVKGLVYSNYKNKPIHYYLFSHLSVLTRGCADSFGLLGPGCELSFTTRIQWRHFICGAHGTKKLLLKLSTATSLARHSVPAAVDNRLTLYKVYSLCNCLSSTAQQVHNIHENKEGILYDKVIPNNERMKNSLDFSNSDC